MSDSEALEGCKKPICMAFATPDSSLPSEMHSSVTLLLGLSQQHTRPPDIWPGPYCLNKIDSPGLHPMTCSRGEQQSKQVGLFTRPPDFQLDRSSLCQLMLQTSKVEKHPWPEKCHEMFLKTETLPWPSNISHSWHYKEQYVSLNDVMLMSDVTVDIKSSIPQRDWYTKSICHQFDQGVGDLTSLVAGHTSNVASHTTLTDSHREVRDLCGKVIGTLPSSGFWMGQCQVGPTIQKDGITSHVGERHLESASPLQPIH